MLWRFYWSHFFFTISVHPMLDKAKNLRFREKNQSRTAKSKIGVALEFQAWLNNWKTSLGVDKKCLGKQTTIDCKIWTKHGPAKSLKNQHDSPKNQFCKSFESFFYEVRKKFDQKLFFSRFKSNKVMFHCFNFQWSYIVRT